MNKNSDKKIEQSDWLANSKQFARIPLEILSADLTKRELELFILLASISPKNGCLGNFSKGQKTYAEMLGWFNKGKPHNGHVSETLEKLRQKKLVTTKSRAGLNASLDYYLHLPDELKCRPVTDKKTPEYLAEVKLKRQNAKAKLEAKLLAQALEPVHFEKEGMYGFDDFPEDYLESIETERFTDDENYDYQTEDTDIEFLDSSALETSVATDVPNDLDKPRKTKIDEMLEELADDVRLRVESRLKLEAPNFSEMMAYQKLNLFVRIRREEINQAPIRSF